MQEELRVRLRDFSRDPEFFFPTNEEKIRGIIACSGDVVWDRDLASDRMWWSSGWLDIFGHDPARTEVSTHQFRMEQIHPHDRELALDAIDQATRRQPGTFCIAYRFRTAKGDYRQVLDRGAVLIDTGGTPFRIIGTLTEVGKINLAPLSPEPTNPAPPDQEKQLRFLIDFIPQMVWTATATGQFDYFNEKWMRFTGLDLEETLQHAWSRVLHPEDNARAWKVWRHSLKTGADFEMEYRMRRSDGIYCWFLARALPMRDGQGQILKWFGTCTNIDERKAAERLLEERVQERTAELSLINKQLEASNHDLTQFASIASHDLREPLRKIHFFSQLIRERYPEDITGTLSGYVNRITRAADRATALIHDLLSYSRLSAEDLFEPVNLNDTVAGILLDFELVIGQKNAVITCDPLPVITAIPGQMRQLFQNIISNGLKFHRPGLSPVIHIRSRFVDSGFYPMMNGTEGRIAEIRIKDEGIGFDNHYSEKIFNLFQRLNSRETHEGTGIGLAIANRIIETHHGLIRAEGKPDHGAEFVLVLPEARPKQ